MSVQKLIENKRRLHSMCRQTCIFFIVLSLLPRIAWADRIYHKDGMLRGKVIEYSPKHYVIKITNGSSYTAEERIKHEDIEELVFSQDRSERGYEWFFTRLYLGGGLSEFKIELQGEFLTKTKGTDVTEPLVVNSPPAVRAGIETGLMVIPYHLALHVGIDHTHVNFNNETQPSYFYQSLSLALSYYLPFQNIYLGLQGRFVIAGSFLYRAIDAFGSESLEDIAFPIQQGSGLGYGITLGKEWYTRSGIVWGLALSYTNDNLKKVDKTFGAGANEYKIKESTEALQYMGIAISLSYD